MGPHLVLLALAGLGLALGWRLTPAPSDRDEAHGIARLLQLGIALIGLTVIALLMLTRVATLGAIECTPEAEQAGACLLGVKERGLFGGGAFACVLGAGFAVVLRKGILDAPSEDLPQRDAEPKPRDPSPATAASPAAPAKAESKPAPKPEPEPEPKPAPAPEPASGKQGSHRRLEGPVFQAFVDDHTVDLDEAIATAATRLRSERVAVVFSRGASKDANQALLALAEAFDAYRYVLEGTAAATEGLTIGDRPDPHEADEIAGADARHAMELALDLAGGLIKTVFLLDTRVGFPEFVLGQLTVLQSVCIAHAHDDVSGACQVVLPGTNPGEKEGELIDDGGGQNQRRPRAWLVERLVEAVRANAEREAAQPEPAQPEPAQPEPAQPEPAPEPADEPTP